jgi:hypothetical protein
VNLFLKLAQSASIEEVMEDLAEIASEKGIHLPSAMVKRSRLEREFELPNAVAVTGRISELKAGVEGGQTHLVVGFYEPTDGAVVCEFEYAANLAAHRIELYSSAMAASISNQAERAQAQGQSMGELTRAGAAYDVGKLNALANRIRGITGIEGNRISSVGGIYGGLVRAAGTINTERLYANESAAAQARLNARDIWARNDQAISDLNAERKQQSVNLETDRAADTQNWVGGKIIKGSEWLGGAARTGLSDSQTGRQTLQGRIAGSVIELGGGAYGLYQQYQSIQNRADGKQRALTEGFDTRIANQETASRSLVQNEGAYLSEMIKANRWRAVGLTAAEVAGANWAVAGANSGAAVAKGGVNQGYRLDLQANRITYDGAVNAATQVRDASFEAARLRALSSVVSAVGHNVARDMEQGLTLRY